MLAFEVSLNGKVSAHTSRPKASRGDGTCVWWGQQPLVVGDTVTVRIVDVEETDEPSEMSAPGMIRSWTR